MTGGFHTCRPVDGDGPVLQDEFGIQQERQLQRLFGVRSMAEMHMPQTWLAVRDEGREFLLDMRQFRCGEGRAEGAEVRHAEVLVEHGIALPGIEDA